MNLQTELLDQISKYNIKVVDVHDPITNPTEFMNYVKDLKGVEGFVIAWESGYRVKIKAEEYLRFHKTKEAIVLEKNVVDMLVNETMDDAKAFMQDADRQRVTEFEAEFWAGISRTVHQLEEYFKSISMLDRKTWALEHMASASKQNPFTPSIVFSMYDGKDARTLVLNCIRKHTSSQTKIDAARILWDGARWEYNFNEEG